MRGYNGCSDRDRDHRISYLRVIHLVWVALTIPIGRR